MHTYSLLSLLDEHMDGNPSQDIQDERALQTCFNQDDPFWQRYKSNNAFASLVDLERQNAEFMDVQDEFKRL